MLRGLTAALCGGLLALCLPAPGLCPLAWVAVAPLFRLLRRSPSRGSAAALGACFGFSLNAVAFHWIYSTCRFAGIAPPLAGLVWAALAASQSLGWTALAALAWRSNPWGFAACGAALEFLLSRFAPGACLILLEYTQWRFPSWFQGAAFAGPHGLALLLLLWNAALAELVESRAWKNLALASLLAGGWLGYGVWSLAGRASAGEPRRAAILQPAVDQYQKWDAAYDDRIRASLDELLARASSEKPELVLWPESSVPGWLEEPENLRWLRDRARRSKTSHLVGTLTRENGGRRSSAVLLDPSGKVLGSYHKRRLVPFGEYVPLRRTFAPWIGILSRMGDLDAGPGDPPPLRTPLGPVRATVCYEALFPRLNRAAGPRAPLIVNLTNDGWYKDTWGPRQHFHANAFRAVENRAALLRSANTGISGAFDPYGIVTARLDLSRRGVLLAEVPASDPFPNGSPYSRWGDWLGWGCAALAPLLLFRGARNVEADGPGRA